MRQEKLHIRVYSRRDFLKLSVYLGASSMISSIDLGEDETDISETLVLNERVSEIFSYYKPLSFDKLGNLQVDESVEEDEELFSTSISVIPTEFAKHVKERVESVDLLVVHYDAAVRYLSDGSERNAKNTVNGLNGNDPDGDGIGASTQWCVDGFPISNNENGEGGYGVLQTQYASGDPEIPYQGKHTFIGVVLKTGEKDINAIETIERFRELGVSSNLQRLVDQGKNRYATLNKYSVGFEQIGTHFDPGFPDFDQPTRRQYANALTLTIACMKQFDLTAWDVVGHHEIQQKSDPGYYYMGTFRYLIGIAALKGLVPQELVFDKKDGRKYELRYFEKVSETVRIINRYGRYKQWEDYIGYQKLIDSLNDWYEVNRVFDIRKRNSI